MIMRGRCHTNMLVSKWNIKAESLGMISRKRILMFKVVLFKDKDYFEETLWWTVATSMVPFVTLAVLAVERKGNYCRLKLNNGCSFLFELTSNSLKTYLKISNQSVHLFRIIIIVKS